MLESSHRWLGLFGAVVLVAACSPVRHVTIRSDFEEQDKRSLLRLSVTTAPLPGGDPQVGAIWSTMARRYVNHHRDFIAKVERAEATVPKEGCEAGIDGDLRLKPLVHRLGNTTDIEVEGTLLRCRDGVEVWKARVRGSWPSADPNISSVMEEYGEEADPKVLPWIGPSFHALRALLETLPYPVLENDDDIMEKIELGE